LPGFGHSSAPPAVNEFKHFAQAADHFVEQLGLPRYSLYIQDYGAPMVFDWYGQGSKRLRMKC
jgi:hypothetical protein